MEPINVEAEYREYVATTSDGANLGIDNFISNKVGSGQWVEDDGDYYTAEEWDAEEERAAEAYEQRILREQAEFEEREAEEYGTHTVGGITYVTGDFDR